MNRFYIFTKTVFQIFLYLTEVVGMTYLLVYLSSFVQPYNSCFEFIERMIEFYVVYQILVIIVLGNLNDIKTDSLLRYKTTLKKCIQYCDSKTAYIKNEILKDIERQLDTGTFNDISIRNNYIIIRDNIDNLNKTSLNMDLINTEHSLEHYSLKWKYSFVLRLFK